jgi:hypothetical protein
MTRVCAAHAAALGVIDQKSSRDGLTLQVTATHAHQCVQFTYNRRLVPEKHLVTIDTRRLQFICSIEGVVRLAYAALLDRCTESASMPKQRALVRSPRFAITINETPPWRNAWQSKELSRLPRKSERWCMLRGVRPNVMHAVPDTTRKVRGSSCSSPKQLLQSGSG